MFIPFLMYSLQLAMLWPNIRIWKTQPNIKLVYGGGDGNIVVFYCGAKMMNVVFITIYKLRIRITVIDFVD